MNENRNYSEENDIGVEDVSVMAGISNSKQIRPNMESNTATHTDASIGRQVCVYCFALVQNAA